MSLLQSPMLQITLPQSPPTAVTSLEAESLTFMCRYLRKVGDKLESHKSTLRSTLNDEDGLANENTADRYKYAVAVEDETLRQITEAKSYIIANLHSVLQGIFIKELQGIFIKEFERFLELRGPFYKSGSWITRYKHIYVSSFFMKNLMILPELRCLCISAFVRRGFRPACQCDIFFDVVDARIVLKGLDSNPTNLLEELHLGFGHMFPLSVADLISIINRLPHLSRLHLRCLDPDDAPKLLECFQDKASIRTLVITQSTLAMRASLVNLTNMKQLTTLDLRAMNLPVSQVGQLVCSLDNLSKLNFPFRDFYTECSGYVDLLEWMISNCPHGNCLVKKIKLWLGEMSWTYLCKIPADVLEMIGITPFKYELEIPGGFPLCVTISNTIGVFPKIEGKMANSTFDNFTGSNGEEITDINVTAYYREHNDKYHKSVLEMIHNNVRNARKVSIGGDLTLGPQGSFSPMVSLSNTTEFPFLLEFRNDSCTVQPHGGLVGDILSHSPKLESLSLNFDDGRRGQSQESVTLNREDLHNLFKVKFPNLKKLNIEGSRLHIGEKEVDFIRSIAPGLEELGDLGYWDIPKQRILQLQEENLQLTLKVTPTEEYDPE